MADRDASEKPIMPKMVPDPWTESMKRHPKTSLLARFRPGIPALTPTPANPLAMSVYDARCEITSSEICSPIKLQISQGGSCLALNAMGGYKNRSPVLSYFILGDEELMLKGHFLEVGLADIAYHMALDESRRLIFLGGESRVKSYAWGAPGGDNYKKPLATHILDSGRTIGPIAVLPNGTVVRAGKGNAAVWSLEGLQTHGMDGDKVIEEEVDTDEDTWSDDDDEEIEQSSGSQPTSQLAFTDNSNMKPTHWKPLIQSPSSMLCTTATMGEETEYDCFLLDLEHGGKIATCFLGHGGVVSDFSVSAPDPQVFLTACNDGYARLYDLRRPLPVLTFDACGQGEFCGAVALAHPDGIPTVFTGTGKAEQIKVWDVHARTPVYELATGNNGVSSLAWDAERNSLYAATETSHMDRLGNHHDYRRAKIPKHSNMSHDDDEDGERCWPKGAMHGEDQFGYAFDAGDHRLYSYQFKEDPNPDVLPEYGHATMDESYW
ncbi:hypothetical protein BDV93DRAFT_354678 [Ceratobasidium sp. AG-I]|nr:hypothetical protein BDV93DRAFT_354678 [Ceratobasidium sp. AG-I]